MRYVPHGGQRRAIQFCLSQKYGRAAIWMDPGLGKTSTTYAVYAILKSKSLIKAMLVVAPLPVVHHVWPRERNKWDEFQHLTVKVLHGPRKSQRLREPADVYLINYEGLTWLAKELNLLGWTGDAMPFDMIVFDEASKMKNPDTVRFKLMKDWVSMFKRVIELTGTPTTRSLEDVWAQIYLLDRGKALGQFVTWFRTRYFTAGGHITVAKMVDGIMVQKKVPTALYPKTDAKEQVYEAIKGLVIRMDAKDWIKMPQLMKTRITIDLPPKARELYDQAEDELVLELKKGTLRIANAGVAVGKCLQLANGAVYDDTGVVWEEVHSAKLDALEDLIDELAGKPLLVGYWFDHDRERFEARFPQYAVAGRYTKSKALGSIVDLWNAGELPVLFAQIGKVAYGLNLQEGPAQHMAFFSMVYDLEIYTQFLYRVWRQGQKHKRIICHHILAEDTVDIAAIDTLKRKDTNQQALLDAIKSLNAKRDRALAET